jgi:hypothetical protein
VILARFFSQLVKYRGIVVHYHLRTSVGRRQEFRPQSLWVTNVACPRYKTKMPDFESGIFVLCIIGWQPLQVERAPHCGTNEIPTTFVGTLPPLRKTASPTARLGASVFMGSTEIEYKPRNPTRYVLPSCASKSQQRRDPVYPDASDHCSETSPGVCRIT